MLFRSLANLTQHVSFPKHRFNHTLDLVISQTDFTLRPVVSQCPISPSDHFPNLFSLNISRPPSSPISEHLLRAIPFIKVERFTGDIISSRLITHPPSNPSDLIDSYNSTLTNLNVRSSTNPLQYTALADFAESNNIYIFALPETWTYPNTTSAQLFDSIPHGFTSTSNPRPVSSSCTSSVVGGGTAFLLREPFKIISSPDITFKSFEMSTVTLKLPHSKLSHFNIHRPPSSSDNFEKLHHSLSSSMTFKLLSLPYLLHHMTFSLLEISTYMLS